MAKKDKEGLLPGTDYELGEKIDLLQGNITPMCYFDIWVMARYNSQAPYVEKISSFIDRVDRNLPKDKK